MLKTKKGAFGFGALIQKIQNWFQFEYDYWWNDFRDSKYYEDFGINPPGFKEKWRSLKYKLSNKIRIKLWDFKQSFKWHVRCYLVFWKLPKLLQYTLDGFAASESISTEEEKEHYDYRDLVYSMMEDDVADRIWCDHLTMLNKEEADLTDSEKSEIHQAIKNKYEVRQLVCPDKYLTEDEAWDIAERAYENGVLAYPGGPDHDYRPGAVHAAKRVLKKHKFKSQYAGDWGSYDK